MAGHDDLYRIEDELRRHRPEPRPEFLRQTSERLTAPASRAGRREGSRLRLGLALGFAAVFATAFAAVGALGYAETSARDAVSGTVGVVADVVRTEKTAKPADVRRRGPAVGSGVQSRTGVAAAERFQSPGATASLFQYPRFVVVCIGFGPKQFTIVIPRFLVPFFEPFIVNFGPCGTVTRSSGS
jgi:hypothetical protein